jgi:hydroxypyruvate reductase
MIGAERAEELSALAADLRRAFADALAGFSLRALVADALPPLPPKRALVRVIAIGKAAVPMMQGALDRWPDRIDRGLVVTVASSSEAATFARPEIDVLAAPHPIPDERSVAAAERALALASGLGAADLVVALVSGGASSLAALPPEGMALDDKRALVRELLESGASIRDVNLVRRHASRFKGGRLAAAAAPARVLTLAVSDVIGGALHDIGSGPSVPDPTTLDEARAVLRRFAPSWEARARLAESLKLDAAPRWRARVIAGPGDFAAALGRSIDRALQDRRDTLSGVRPRVFAPTQTRPADEGDAAAIAAKRVEQARALPPGEVCVLPCEPTLQLAASHGRGGRAGWVALRALADLPADVALLCGATDGTDGSSGSAGAVVTPLLLADVDRADIDRALAAFDDAPLHERLRSRIEGAPTGLNFADVHVLARLP